MKPVIGPPQWLVDCMKRLKERPAPSIESVLAQLKASAKFRKHYGKQFTCETHGWSCLGTPCPRCKSGDAPKCCHKHGWNSSAQGCPYCTNT